MSHRINDSLFKEIQGSLALVQFLVVPEQIDLDRLRSASKHAALEPGEGRIHNQPSASDVRIINYLCRLVELGNMYGFTSCFSSL